MSQSMLAHTNDINKLPGLAPRTTQQQQLTNALPPLHVLSILLWSIEVERSHSGRQARFSQGKAEPSHPPSR